MADSPTIKDAYKPFQVNNVAKVKLEHNIFGMLTKLKTQSISLELTLDGKLIIFWLYEHQKIRT